MGKFIDVGGAIEAIGKLDPFQFTTLVLLTILVFQKWMSMKRMKILIGVEEKGRADILALRQEENRRIEAMVAGLNETLKRMTELSQVTVAAHEATIAAHEAAISANSATLEAQKLEVELIKLRANGLANCDGADRPSG